MTKTWYNKTTGNGAVFNDTEDMSNWPNYQETNSNSPLAITQEQKVRSERDFLLLQSDNMALADRITDDWRTYRQALRDLPAQDGFPDVAFPVAPS